MIKKLVPRIVAVFIMFIALFFLSYKMSAKLAADKGEKEQEPSSSVIGGLVTETAAPETSSELPSEEASSAENSTASGEAETLPAPSEENDKVLPEPTVINMPSDSGWCVVLLNKYYKMNSTYETPVELALDNSGIYLDKRVAEKFREMYNAAAAAGITLTPAAGYVSLERQERKFNKQVELYMAGGMAEEEAKAKTAFTILPPGCSESNYGLSVDIGWLSYDFAESPAYAWLKNNAADYGFVERYQEAKTQQTHFNAQPWHWRFVGADAAKAMNEQGLCLEEYLGKVN